MSMKWYHSKTFCFLLFSLAISVKTYAGDEQIVENKYDRRVNDYRKAWAKLIPTHTKIQYAGDMGLVSIGIGWDYGKRGQWETDLFLGFLPKYSTEDNKLTFTVKQTYIPWSVYIGKGFSVKPLTCGMYVNTILDDDFWSKDPGRYPSGYYNFSSKVRFHIFLGQYYTYTLKENQRRMGKSISLFYELSTCDLYLVSAVGNSYLTPKDYLRLSFGVKIQLF